MITIPPIAAATWFGITLENATRQSVLIFVPVGVSSPSGVARNLPHRFREVDDVNSVAKSILPALDSAFAFARHRASGNFGPLMRKLAALFFCLVTPAALAQMAQDQSLKGQPVEITWTCGTEYRDNIATAKERKEGQSLLLTERGRAVERRNAPAAAD